MIKDSFTYIAVLIFAAAVLVYLPRLIKGNAARKFFSFAPPVVLIYLGLMALCTLGAWDLQATSAAYSSLKIRCYTLCCSLCCCAATFVRYSGWDQKCCLDFSPPRFRFRLGSWFLLR